MRPATAIIIAYMLGSIPFGYLIVRATQGADIRETGSGGTGATNVSRRAGKGAGVLTLILDALKGATAVVIAKQLLLPHLPPGQTGPIEHVLVGHLGSGLQDAYWWVAAAAVAAIVGHIFPVWLGFRGGKGVAIGVGVFLMLAPTAVALAAAVFVLIVGLTRYISLGSIVAATTIPIFVLVQNVFIRPMVSSAPMLTAATAGAALIIFAHRKNVGRLFKGTEPKFK